MKLVSLHKLFQVSFLALGQYHSAWIVVCGLARANCEMLKIINNEICELIVFLSLTRFNVAEIGAMSRDIPFEAKVLVRRMLSDSNVNVTKDWKLITILIGPNDFCLDFCYQRNPDKAPFNHERDLIQTLRILRENLPRTIVNLVTPPSKWIEMTKTKKTWHSEGHSCWHYPQFIGPLLTQSTLHFLSPQAWKWSNTCVANRTNANRRIISNVPVCSVWRMSIRCRATWKSWSNGRQSMHAWPKWRNSIETISPLSINRSCDMSNFRANRMVTMILLTCRSIASI